MVKLKRLLVTLLAFLLVFPGQISFAQGDTATRRKVLSDLAPALVRLRAIQRRQITPDVAFDEGGKLLATIQKYESDPLFAGSKELTDLYNDEFLTLYYLGVAGYIKEGDFIGTPAGHAPRLMAADVRATHEQELQTAIDYLLKAIARSSDLSDAQRRSGLPYVYLILGRVYYYQLMPLLDADNYLHSTPELIIANDVALDNAQKAFADSADAFKTIGNTQEQADALDERAAVYFSIAANSVTAIQGEYGDQSTAQLYLKSIELDQQAVALSPNNGLYLSNLGSALARYNLRIEMGSLVDAQGKPEVSVDLNPLLTEEIQDANRLLRLSDTQVDKNNVALVLSTRGFASVRLAFRTNDVALARQGVRDLEASLPLLLTQESNYDNYALESQTLLGRAYLFIGDRPDLALSALQSADATAQKLGSNINFIRYFDWNKGLNTQNAILEGYALTALGRTDEAIAAFKKVLETLKPSTEFIAGRAARGLNPDLLYPDTLSGLAQAYQSAGQYDNAVDQWRVRRVYFEGRLKTLQAQPSPDPTLLTATQFGVVDTLLQSSVALIVVGKNEEALTGLQKALDLTSALNDSRLTVDAQLRSADIYLLLDLKKDAANLYTKVIDVATAANLPQQLERALLGLGTLQRESGALDLAQTTLTKGNQAAQAINDTEGQIRALLGLGQLALQGAKPNRTNAEKSFREAIALADHAQDTRLSLDPLMALGDFQAQGGDGIAANVTYFRALTSSLAINDREAIARSLGRIARVTPQPQVAAQAFANAVNLIEQTQRGYQSASLKTQYAANYAPIYGDYLNLLFGQKQYDTAFEIAERSRARAFLDQLAVGPLNIESGASADLLTQERVARQRIDAAQSVLIAAQNDTKADAKQVAQIQRDLETAESDYAKIFTRMQAENPVLASLTGVQVAPLAKVQSVLDADTTLLDYYTTDQQSFVFLITAKDFSAVALPTTRNTLADAVTRFRADEKQADGLSDLSAALIKPILEQVHTKHLIIVPHNVLNYLPFAALPLDSGGTLGDQFAIRYMPSATALVLLPGAPKQMGKLLALGNPTAEGQRPLPFAEAEVTGVGNITGGDVVTGADATKALLIKQAPDSGIVYVAAHATLNPVNPLFSALELAPSNGTSGRLEANEIYPLDLTHHTALVVLSACQTAVGTLSAGDEFTGINRAFLYAGTPSVIASLWSVDDKATSILMQEFFKARLAGKSNSEALQSAQQIVRSYKDEQGNTPYTSPYYWAAFILTGVD